MKIYCDHPQGKSSKTLIEKTPGGDVVCVGIGTRRECEELAIELRGNITKALLCVRLTQD